MAANDRPNRELFDTADQTRTPNDMYQAKHGEYQCLDVPRTDKGAAPPIPPPFTTRGG